MFTGNCFDRYLSITPDGDIVPCGRWDNTQFLYGNINKDSIEKALLSDACNKFRIQRKKIVEYCGDCEHYDICHGGCPFSGFYKMEIFPNLTCIV